jgi:hypothetical protein
LFIIAEYMKWNTIWAVVNFQMFDFHTTCPFVHYKFLPLIHLVFIEFRFSCMADLHSFQAVTVWCSVNKANHSVSVWSWQHYYLCSLAAETKTAVYRQMLLLSGNAAGSCKLKPLFMYNVENTLELWMGRQRECCHSSGNLIPIPGLLKQFCRSGSVFILFQQLGTIAARIIYYLKHCYFWTVLLGADNCYRTFTQKLKLFFCLLIRHVNSAYGSVIHIHLHEVLHEKSNQPAHQGNWRKVDVP